MWAVGGPSCTLRQIIPFVTVPFAVSHGRQPEPFVPVSELGKDRDPLYSPEYESSPVSGPAWPAWPAFYISCL